MTPRMEIVVGGSRREAKVDAIIDTGFDGDLCIPATIAEKLGLELIGRTTTTLADGSRRPDLLFAGWVEFLEKRRKAWIFLSSGPTLIGTGLLEDTVLSIDFGANDVRLTRKPAGRRRK